MNTPRFILLALAAGLAGCANFSQAPMPPGSTDNDAMQRFGRPTGVYPMPDGTRRLEYATGPFGRTTWMVDVDAAGRITASRQVLNESNFADFQRRSPGMTRDELLRELGRPGESRGYGFERGQIWTWRYPTNDCLLFEAAIGGDGRVRDSGYNVDPRCDAPNPRN